MNNEEIKSLIDQLKAQGLDDEQIMDTFYKTFEKGEMDRKDLETLANAMGYELTDDFKNDETPDPIAAADAGNITKEEAENAKALEPGQSADEFKDKIDNMKDGNVENEDNSDTDDSDKDEDWEKAQKLFRI